MNGIILWDSKKAKTTLGDYKPSLRIRGSSFELSRFHVFFFCSANLFLMRINMFYRKRNCMYSSDGACTSMFFGVTATPSAVFWCL